jgi:hypothetical protein
VSAIRNSSGAEKHALVSGRPCLTSDLWILAILLAPVLLIRFRKRWAAVLQLGGHEPNHESIRRPITGRWHPYAYREFEDVHSCSDGSTSEIKVKRREDEPIPDGSTMG